MKVTFKDPVAFASNIKAAMRAASKDFTRAHLNCIRLEFHKGKVRFVATNGHWLFVNETVADCDGAAEVLLSLADAKSIVKAIVVSKKASTWAVEVDTDARTVRQLGTTVAYVPVDASFPPYVQIIPPTQGTKQCVISFAADYLADVFGAFQELSPNAGVTIETGEGELDPAVLTSNACPDALVVLMPRRDEARSAPLRARYRNEKPSVAKAS